MTTNGATRVKTMGLVALVLIAGCAETPEKAQARIQRETEAARPLIQGQLGRYVQAAAMGNVDSIMLLFTDDAVLMPPNRPALKTRDEIRASFAATGPFAITFGTSNLIVTGDIAIERGIWQATMTPPGSAFAVARDGKYLAHWHRVNGEWRMAEQIWNDDYRPIGM